MTKEEAEQLALVEMGMRVMTRYWILVGLVLSTVCTAIAGVLLVSSIAMWIALGEFVVLGVVAFTDDGR